VGGSGLGLVISRQMAQALGGQLDLRSRPGEGTQAVLRLPASGLAGRSVP
jgi:signal transduction histidine kinase